MPFPWPAVIAGVASLGGGFLQGRAQDSALQRQEDHQIRMFDLQNEYNHPARQRERMEEANINPFWDGSSFSPSVGSVPAPNPAQAQVNPMANAFETGLTTLSKVLDIQQKKQALEQDAETHSQNMAMGGADLAGKKIANIKSQEDLEIFMKYGRKLTDEEHRNVLARNEALHNKNYIDGLFAREIKEGELIIQNIQREILEKKKGTIDAETKWKIQGLKHSSQLKKWMIENKDSLVDPNAPVVEQLITVLMNALFQGALPEGFDAKNVLPNLSNLLPWN